MKVVGKKGKMLRSWRGACRGEMTWSSDISEFLGRGCEISKLYGLEKFCGQRQIPKRC